LYLVFQSKEIETMSDDEDEDGDGTFSRELQPHRGIVASFASDMIHAVEKGALAGGAGAGSQRPIASRLSGFTDTVRLSSASILNDEKTGLLEDGTNSGGTGHHHHHHRSTPPALIEWIIPANLCALAYALYNVFIKKGSATIHPILGGVILQFVATSCGTLLLIFLLLREKAHEIFYDNWGLIWSTAAGLWVGTAEMLSFTVSGMGVPATQSIPVIIGGSVLFGSILGYFALGEVMVLHGWSGVVMLTIGIGLVATDPREKVEEGGTVDPTSEPPILVWIGPALFCALSYALYYLYQERFCVSQSCTRRGRPPICCCHIWIVFGWYYDFW
jgi:uncharacterized membrane protein